MCLAKFALKIKGKPTSELMDFSPNRLVLGDSIVCVLEYQQVLECKGQQQHM